jgi:hypothetical protein
MRTALALALGLAAALLACQCNAAVPIFPTMPQNWYSPQYVGVEIVQGTDIALKGSMVWQMDANFSRSAFTSSTGGYSNFMDWDGKTYGSGSGPAIYWFIEGYQCEWWYGLRIFYVLPILLLFFVVSNSL